MQPVKAQMIVWMVSDLESLQQTASATNGKLSPKDKSLLTQRLKPIHDECERLGLEASIDQVKRLHLFLAEDDVKHFEIGHQIRSLTERVSDDLGRAIVLTIGRDKARFWTEQQLFGRDVYERFPSATIDIEEAGKCLACNRGTAAVFHLMRAMEVGLKETARALAIPYAPSWESYLNQISTQINVDWKKKPAKWRKEEPFFRDVQVHLHAVKVAWRNPTMHVVKDYTPDMAEDVFNAVRGFMRHLSTKLREPKLRRRK